MRGSASTTEESCEGRRARSHAATDRSLAAVHSAPLIVLLRVVLLCLQLIALLQAAVARALHGLICRHSAN